MEDTFFFLEPISRIAHHIAGFAFVDNTDLIILNLEYPNTTEWEIFDNMQDCVNKWQGGRWVSSGVSLYLKKAMDSLSHFISTTKANKPFPVPKIHMRSHSEMSWLDCAKLEY